MLGCMYPFGSCFSLDICPGVGLQGHMVALFFVFLKGICILISIVAIPIYIPTNSIERFPSVLILCVNLTGLKDAHIVDKTLFLGVSVRAFLEDFST